MGLDFEYEYGQTPIDEDEKLGLKIKTITTQGELNQFEQLNIEKAIQWTLSNTMRPERILTDKFVTALHKKMFGDVWQWAGIFRTSKKEHRNRLDSDRC